MKKVLKFTTLFCGLAALSCLNLAAQESSAGQGAEPSGMKIVFVNPQVVLYGTQEGKRELKKVQGFANQKQTELNARRKELEDLKQQFSTQRASLNVAAQNEMAQKIQDKETELKRFQEDTQNELDRRQRESLGKLSSKLTKIINDYAQQHKYAAILLRDAQLEAYVDPSLDISQEIIKIYDQKYPVAEATKTPPSNPKP